MSLDPIDPIHAAQIQAGILGRQQGHAFEDRITLELNALSLPRRVGARPSAHVQRGDPAIALLDYVASDLGIREVTGIVALSTGALATSEKGRAWMQVNGVEVRRCKSDLIVTLRSASGEENTVGVSTKQRVNPG